MKHIILQDKQAVSKIVLLPLDNISSIVKEGDKISFYLKQASQDSPSSFSIDGVNFEEVVQGIKALVP